MYDTVKTRFEYTGSVEQTALFEATMKKIYDGSSLARLAMHQWLSSHPGQNITVNFSADDASVPFVSSGIVNIDPEYFTNALYISITGRIVHDSLLSGLAHELGHAVGGKFDNDTFSNLPGDNVTLTNRWLVQLGLAPQATYLAYEKKPYILVAGQDYTDGALIRNAIYDRDQYTHNTPISSFSFDAGNVDLTAAGVKGSTLVIGGADVNAYNGTAFNDWIYGGGGGDTIRGGAGNDVIYGDGRFDFTQIGDDHLYGDGGNDRIYGGKGTDTIYGGIGIDILVGGAGGDFIYGEAGNDTIYGGFGVNDATVEEGVDGADTIDGGAGNDTINGQEGDDILTGGANNDTISGGKGDDSLNGGTGIDILSGDEGDDVLGGGDGDDILYAGPGRDSLVGGKGNDIIDLSRGAEDATILYIKSDGLDTVRGPTGSNITLSFIDLAANQLNFEFRYTSVAYTFHPDETRPQYYDTATYQGDLHITSKLSAAAGVILEGTSVVYQRYPYYQEYLHPGLQKITFATAPTIVTASGAIIFGLGVGDPDIDISFVEVVTLPDPASAPAVFAASAMPQVWLVTADTDSWMSDMQDDGLVAGRFANDNLLANLADYAFA